MDRLSHQISAPSQRPRAGRLARAIWERAISSEITGSADDDFAHLVTTHEQTGGTLESYAGLFYFCAQDAYRQIYSGDDHNKAFTQRIFRSAATELLSEVMELLDSTTHDNHKWDAFHGIVNELTPIALANKDASIMYLGSRDDDAHKIDLWFHPQGSLQTRVPVQIKTEELSAVSKAIPENGVLITAADFNNEELEISRIIARLHRGEGEKGDHVKLSAARTRLTETINRRYADPRGARIELNRIRGLKLASATLGYSIGSMFPELGSYYDKTDQAG